MVPLGDATAAAATDQHAELGREGAPVSEPVTAPRPGSMPQPPVDVWHLHTAHCLKCRNNPYDFCPIGLELLKKAVEA